MPAVGTTHDIRIGSNYFMLRPGSYSKRAAPLFGARFATGDPDYNNLNFWQRWAQTCWVGGFGAPTWEDDAMFDEGVGVDTAQHEVMVLTRDLGPSNRTTGNWDLDTGDSPRQRWFTVFNDKLYLLSIGDLDLTPPSRLYVFTEGSSTWTLVKTFAEAVRWMEPFGAYLVFGDGGTTMNRMSTAEAFTTFNKPAGVTDTPYTMKVYRGKLYVGFGKTIWRLKPDFLWDGSTAFYTAEDVNYINVSEIHLGFLYLASQNGHMLRTDGNNTFDLWAFEPYVGIQNMRSFDGKLFVMALELLDGTSARQSVLYQFSGAAVTELKRWGKVGTDCAAGRLRVIGHSLWFGASNMLGIGDSDGFGIARYDPVEDGYHIFASNMDTATYTPGTAGVNLVVEDVAFHKGYIYCSVNGYGVFRTAYSYNDNSRYLATYDTTPSGGGVSPQNGGWYTSSDFDAGTPGLLKLWHSMLVHVDLPNSSCSIILEYSTNGGETWTTAGNLTGAAAGGPRYGQTFVLGAGTPVRSTRLKYRVTLRTTDSTRSPALRGIIVKYLPIPEPNWVWDFTIVLSDTQLLHDGTTETVDVNARLAALETAFRTGNLVEYQDIGGTVWAGSSQPGVFIQDMTEQVFVTAPPAHGAREREVRLVLHEAVEAY